MEQPQHTPEPSRTPPRKRLSRDDRLRILTLRNDAKWKYKDIARVIGCTERVVQYTCEKHQPTPQHHKVERPLKLNKEEINQLKQFVLQSKMTRRIIY